MIRKPNFKLNWKYALGELVLIFLGISLAIGFQNFNEDRKRQQLETEILQQLYDDISANMGDLRGDLEQLEKSFQSHVKIINDILNNEPYDPMMAFDFEWLYSDEYTYPIKISYDRLKSIGLELINNDSLRSGLELLYEFDYPRISKTESFHPDITEYFSEFYQHHFRPNTDYSLNYEYDVSGITIRYPMKSSLFDKPITIGYVPLDYELLKQNSQFQVLLKQTLTFRNYKLNRYQNITSMSEEILRVIKRELGNNFKAP